MKDALTFAIAVHLVHLSVRFTDGPQLRLPEYTLTTHTQTLIKTEVLNSAASAKLKHTA